MNINTRDLGLAIRDFLQDQTFAMFRETSEGELEESGVWAVVEFVDVSDAHNPVVHFDNNQRMTIRIIAGG